MANWLAKSEPSVYSWNDLERDRSADWSGVHNALALRHLRAMRPGDGLLFYHSGVERAVVGIARVTSHPRPDPRDDRGSWTVDIRAVRSLRAPISLSELRGDAGLRDLALFRMSRLSVLPVSSEQWARILRHEGGATPAGPRHGSARGSRSSHRAAARRNRGST